jgi:hypothetical protein
MKRKTISNHGEIKTRTAMGIKRENSNTWRLVVTSSDANI